MNHFRARRLLSELHDGALDAGREERVRRHLEGCGTCRRALRRIEAADGLLARLPRALLSLETGSDARLAALAQWGPRPTPAGGAYGPLPAVCSLAAAALAVVLTLSVSHWSPVVGDLGSYTVVASVMPDTSYLPMGWR